jgi:hypothetical protein
MKANSIEVAKAAIKMATSERNEEKRLEECFKERNILTEAVDIGGILMLLISKIMERALVASKKNRN